MSKSIIEKDGSYCYICQMLGDWRTKDLEEHHIMHGTANRKLSEKYGLKVHLCRYHHREGWCAVHQNRQMDLKLIKIAQKRFEELYGHDEWMKVFMKNYLWE